MNHSLLVLVQLLASALFVGASHGCPQLTARSPPNHINDLRVDDFSVVMAMGDSMTAGFNSVKPSMHEYRGVSFSIGGDLGAITMPNLLRAVKQEPLVGPSVGALSKPTVKAPCAGADVDAVCRLSAAIDGSDLQDLIDMQVRYLRDALDQAPWAANVSRTTSWKLLTIFSGLDDVVFYNQSDPSKQSTSTNLFATNLDKLLQAVHVNLPRTFVNLVSLPERFDPSVTTSGWSCKLFKWYSEAMGIHWTSTSGWLATIKTYNQIIEQVAAKWKKRQLTDFAVSLQPFMKLKNLTSVDFDTADCFHPNLAAHQGMAVALWNNMLAQTDAEKQRSWDAGDVPKCPNADSRLLV